MKSKLTILLLCLSLLAFTAHGAVAKNRARKKVGKERETAITSNTEVDICDIKANFAPVFCYCNPNRDGNFEEANCLIIAHFESDDEIWDHFSSQPNLQRLTFTVKNEGNIDYVPTSILRRLVRLYTLNFQYAKLHTIESKAFADLPSVATINLNKNNIHVIKWHAFERLANLTVLNLDDNFISELNRDQFYDVPHIQKLFMNHNNLTTLNENAFRHLPSLQELELSNNRIASLTRESFLGLHLLQRLDLRSNMITSLHDRVFYEMQDLQDLDLDQNHISHISEKAFDSMKNLRRLHISDNKLTMLESDFLSGAPAISLLDLRFNKLTAMTFDNVKPIITNLYANSSNLHLEGNKFECHCKLAWIWGLRNETKNSKLREELDKLRCFLENNSNDFQFDEEAEKKRALETARNPAGGYSYHSSRDEQYQNDEHETSYDDASDYEENDYQDVQRFTNQRVEQDGKFGYYRQLNQLKVEDLPCPSPSRNDVMASEQPANRQGHSTSSIFSFSSSGATASMASFALVAWPIFVCFTMLPRLSNT